MTPDDVRPPAKEAGEVTKRDPFAQPDGASAEAKALGCKSLAEVSRVTDVGYVTLHGWHKKRPELFRTICIGVTAIEKAGDIQEFLKKVSS